MFTWFRRGCFGQYAAHSGGEPGLRLRRPGERGEMAGTLHQLIPKGLWKSAICHWSKHWSNKLGRKTRFIYYILIYLSNKTAVFTNVLYLSNVVWDIFFIFIIDFETFFLLCSTGPSSSDIVIISYRTVLITYNMQIEVRNENYMIKDGFWINTSVNVFKIMPMLVFFAI